MTAMIARGLAAILLMLGAAAPLQAETEDAEALAELAKPGRVLMLRHALAPGFGDPPGFKVDDCATQRNLDDVGRKQARLLGARMRAAGIRSAKVYSSQWCRCLETARLLGLGKVEPLAALNSFFDRTEERASRLRQVEAFLSRLPRDGDPVVLVTHQVTISGITDRGVGSGGGYVLRLDASGKPTVVGALSID
jgi:broad specificity phosphatase PhoE